jgi:hypothetical protein
MAKTPRAQTTEDLLFWIGLERAAEFLHTTVAALPEVSGRERPIMIQDGREWVQRNREGFQQLATVFNQALRTNAASSTALFWAIRDAADDAPAAAALLKEGAVPKILNTAITSQDLERLEQLMRLIARLPVIVPLR